MKDLQIHKKQMREPKKEIHNHRQKILTLPSRRQKKKIITKDIENLNIN